MSNSGNDSELTSSSTEQATDDRSDPPLWHEQRRHRRVNLDITVRFLLPDRSEHEGRILDISAGGIAIQTDVDVQVGQTVIMYIDEVGRFEGDVRRVFAEGFAVEFRTTWLKIERTAEQLTWHVNKKRYEDLANLRRYPREATTKNAILRRADGTLVACKVADMSVGGLAIEIGERPPVGEIITIGHMEGRVVRHYGAGIAIELINVKERKRGLATSLF